MFNSYRDAPGCYGDQNVSTFQQSMVDGGKVGPGTGAALPTWGIHPTGPHATTHLPHSAAHPPHAAHGPHPNYHSAFHHHSGSSTMDAYSSYSMAQVPPKDQDAAHGKDRMRSSPANTSTSSPGNSWQNNRSRYPGTGSANGAFLPYPAQLGPYDGQMVEPSHVAHSHPHSRKAVWPSSGPVDSAYPQIVSQPYQRDTSMSYSENHRSDVTSSIIRHTTSVSALEVSQRGAPSQSHQQPPMHQQQTMHPSQQHTSPHHELFNQLIQKEREAHRLPGYQETVRHSVVRGHLPGYHEQIYSQHQHQQYCNPQDLLRKPPVPTGGGDNEHRSAFTARQRSSYGHSWNKGSVPYLPFHPPQLLPPHRNTSSAFQPCSKLPDSDLFSTDGVMWSKSGQVDHLSHSHLHQVHSGQPAWLQDPAHLFTSQQSGKQNFHAHPNVGVPPNMLNLDTGQVDPPANALAARTGNTQGLAHSDRGNIHPMTFQSAIPQSQQHVQHLHMQMHHQMYHQQQQQAHQQKQSQLHQGQQQQILHQQSPHSNPQPSPIMNSQSPHTSIQSPQQPSPCAQQHLEQQSQMQSNVSEEEPPKTSDNSNPLRSCIDVRQFLETWNEDTELATPRPACTNDSEAVEASETTEPSAAHGEEGASLVVLDCRSLQREEAANLLNMYPSVQINGVHEEGGLLTCSDESLYNSSTNTVVMETSGVFQNLLGSGCGSSPRSSSASITPPITSPNGPNSTRSLDILLSNALPTPPASQEQHMTSMQTSMPLSTPVNIIGLNSAGLPLVIEPIPQPSMDGSGFDLLSPTSPGMPSVGQKSPNKNKALSSSVHDTPIAASCALETVQKSQSNDIQAENTDMQVQTEISTNLTEEAAESRAVSVILSPVCSEKPVDQDAVHFHSEAVPTPKSDFSKGVLSMEMCDVSPSPALSDTSTDGRKTSSLRAFRKRKLLSPDRCGEMQDSLDSHSHDAIDAPAKITRLSPSTPDIDQQSSQVRPSVLSPVDRSKWAFAQIHESNQLFKSTASSKTVNVTDILKSGQSWELSDSANSVPRKKDNNEEPPKKNGEGTEKSTGEDSALSLKYDKCTSPPIYLSNKDTQTDESRQYSKSKETNSGCKYDLIREMQDKACQKTVDINITTEGSSIELPIEDPKIEVEKEKVIPVHNHILEGEAKACSVENDRISCKEMPDEEKEVKCVENSDVVNELKESEAKQSSKDVKSESKLPVHAHSTASLPVEESKESKTSTAPDPSPVANTESGAKYLSRIVNSSPGKIPKILLSRLRDVREKSRKKNGIMKRLPSIKLMRVNSPCASGADPEYVCSGSSSDEVTDLVSSTTGNISRPPENSQPVPVEDCDKFLSRKQEENPSLAHEPTEIPSNCTSGADSGMENVLPRSATSHDLKITHPTEASTHIKVLSPPHSTTDLQKLPVSFSESNSEPLKMQNERLCLEQECVSVNNNQKSSSDHQGSVETAKMDATTNVEVLHMDPPLPVSKGHKGEHYVQSSDSVEQEIIYSDPLNSSQEHPEDNQHHEPCPIEIECNLNSAKIDAKERVDHINDCLIAKSGSGDNSENTCNGSRNEENKFLVEAAEQALVCGTSEQLTNTENSSLEEMRNSENSSVKASVDEKENSVTAEKSAEFDSSVCDGSDDGLNSPDLPSKAEECARSTATANISEPELPDEIHKNIHDLEDSEMEVGSTQALSVEVCRSSVFVPEQLTSPPSEPHMMEGNNISESKPSTISSNSVDLNVLPRSPIEHPVSDSCPEGISGNNSAGTKEEELIPSVQEVVNLTAPEGYNKCNEESSLEEKERTISPDKSGKSDSEKEPCFVKAAENTSSGMMASDDIIFANKFHAVVPEQCSHQKMLPLTSNNTELSKKLEEYSNGESGIGSIDSHHREDDGVSAVPELHHSPTQGEVVHDSDEQDSRKCPGSTLSLSLPNSAVNKQPSTDLLFMGKGGDNGASISTNFPARTDFMETDESSPSKRPQVSEQDEGNGDSGSTVDLNLLPVEKDCSWNDAQYSCSQEQSWRIDSHHSPRDEGHTLTSSSHSPSCEDTIPTDSDHLPWAKDKELTSVDSCCSSSETTLVDPSQPAAAPLKSRHSSPAKELLSMDSCCSPHNERITLMEFCHSSSVEEPSVESGHSPHKKERSLSESQHLSPDKECSLVDYHCSPCHENSTVIDSQHSTPAEQHLSAGCDGSPRQSHFSPQPENLTSVDSCHASNHQKTALDHIHPYCSPKEPSQMDSHLSPSLERPASTDPHYSESHEGSVSLDSSYSPSSEGSIEMDTFNSPRNKNNTSVDFHELPCEEGPVPLFSQHSPRNDSHQSSSEEVCASPNCADSQSYENPISEKSHHLSSNEELIAVNVHHSPRQEKSTAADSHQSPIYEKHESADNGGVQSPASNHSSPVDVENGEMCSPPNNAHLSPSKSDLSVAVGDEDPICDSGDCDIPKNDFERSHHLPTLSRHLTDEDGSGDQNDNSDSDCKHRAVSVDTPVATNACFEVETPMNNSENCEPSTVQPKILPPKEVINDLIDSDNFRSSTEMEEEQRCVDSDLSGAVEKVNDISIRTRSTATQAVTSGDYVTECYDTCNHCKHSSFNLRELTVASGCRGLINGNLSPSAEDKAFPDPKQPNFDVSRIPLPDECEAIKAFFLISRSQQTCEKCREAQNIIADCPDQVSMTKEHGVPLEDAHHSVVPDEKLYSSQEAVTSELCLKSNQSCSGVDLNITDSTQFIDTQNDDTLETLMDIVDEVSKAVDDVNAGSTDLFMNGVDSKEDVESFENIECKDSCSKLDVKHIQTESNFDNVKESNCNLYTGDNVNNVVADEGNQSKSCSPDYSSKENSTPLSMECDFMEETIGDQNLFLMDEVNASLKETHLETVNPHQPSPMSEEDHVWLDSETNGISENRSVNNHNFSEEEIERDTIDFTSENVVSEGEGKTCEPTRKVSCSPSEWAKEFSDIHRAIGRSVLKLSQNWQSVQVSPKTMEENVCPKAMIEDDKEMGIDHTINSPASNCDDEERREGVAVIDTSVMIMEDTEIVDANLMDSNVLEAMHVEDDLPPLDAPGLGAFVSSPDSDREMPCLERMQTSAVEEPFDVTASRVSEEVGTDLSVEHRKDSSNQMSDSEPVDVNMPTSIGKGSTNDIALNESSGISGTYNRIVYTRSMTAPRKEMLPRNFDDESSDSSDSDSSPSGKSCLHDTSSSSESDECSSESKIVASERRSLQKLSKYKRRRLHSTSSVSDVSSSLSEDDDIHLSGSSCQDALDVRERQSAPQENVSEIICQEEAAEESISAPVEVDQSSLDHANCSANPGVSQLEISDIRTVASTDSLYSSASSAFNLSGFLDSGWSFDVNSPLVTCSSEMLSVDSMYNWPYVEEEVFSESSSTPCRDWSDLGGSGPLQVKCRLGWDRILSEGNGLILGPARIHVQVPGQPPKPEADLRWNIITRHRRRSSSCLEENNNMLPGSKSPVVIVKSIALKRPGATQLDLIHVESGVDLDNSSPAQFIRTKGAMKCFQEPSEPNESKRRKRSLDLGKSPVTTFDSDKTCGEVPRVIIKRTGTGTCYKSFLQAACLQPVVVLERNPRIDAMARQWMVQQRRKRSAELRMHAWKIREDKRNQCPLQVLMEEAENKHEEEIVQPSKNGQSSGTRNIMKVVEILSQWRREEEEKATSEELDCHDSSSELCSEPESKHFEITFSEQMDNSTIASCIDNELGCDLAGNTIEPSDDGMNESLTSSWDVLDTSTAECEASVVSNHWKYDESMPPQSPCMFVAGESVPGTSQGDEFSVHRCDVCEKDVVGYQACISHVKQHPFHCQECLLSFPQENDFMKHLTSHHADLQERHHCLLCQRTFDSVLLYTEHIQSYSHCHMEISQRQTINTLFRMFTGSHCPNLDPATSDDSPPGDWCPKDPGAVHFFHQATPMQIAMQEWQAWQRKESQLTKAKTQRL